LKSEMKSVDLTSQKVLVIRDARSALAAGASQVLVCKNCVVTPSARDFLAQHNIALVTSGEAKAAPPQPMGKLSLHPSLQR
jgi:ethanolamine utilization cobalamin adenosyltransferase